MKLLNIERGAVTVEFENWEMPTLTTITRLAESQAYGGDAPDHDCTDTVGAYAGLLSAFTEAAGFAALLTIDTAAPLTLEAYRARTLYYNALALQKQGQKAEAAAVEAFPALAEGGTHDR